MHHTTTIAQVCWNEQLHRAALNVYTYIERGSETEVGRREDSWINCGMKKSEDSCSSSSRSRPTYTGGAAVARR